MDVLCAAAWGQLPELLSSLAGMAAGTDDEIKCSSFPQGRQQHPPPPWGDSAMRGQGSPGLRKQGGQRLLLTNLCLGGSTVGMHRCPLSQGWAGQVLRAPEANVLCYGNSKDKKEEKLSGLSVST